MHAVSSPTRPPYLACPRCAAVVRVEPAPGNARRIFTGIDIVAPDPGKPDYVLELVWQTLTEYENLAKVCPQSWPTTGVA